MLLTSSTLLQLAKQKAGITSGQVGLSDTDFLSIATRKLQSEVVGVILEKNEEYLVHSQTTAIAASTSTYRLPTRALGSSLRHIYLETNNVRRSLTEYSYMDLEQFSTITTNTIPSGFIMKGNNIQLIPSIGTSPQDADLVMYYFVRPSSLVANSEARQIVSFDTNAKSITFASIPSGFLSTESYDVINHLSGNELILADLTVASIAGQTITFNEDITGVAAGNWVSIAGTSPVPMVPEEFHALLLALVTLEIHQIRQNSAGAQASGNEIKMITEAINVMTNKRIVSKPETIVARSPLLPGNVGVNNAQYLVP